MLTLLAALVYERQREITDTLADPLISTVHRIGARAERRVTQELVSEFRKVAGKETHAIAETVSAVVDIVKTTLDKCPPELAGDVMDRGIALTGGGAL